MSSEGGESVGDWVFGDPPVSDVSGSGCPDCGAAVGEDDWMCAQCGTVVVDKSDWPIRGKHSVSTRGYGSTGSASARGRKSDYKPVRTPSGSRIRLRVTPVGASVAVIAAVAALLAAFALGGAIVR